MNKNKHKIQIDLDPFYQKRKSQLPTHHFFTNNYNHDQSQSIKQPLHQHQFQQQINQVIVSSDMDQKQSTLMKYCIIGLYPILMFLGKLGLYIARSEALYGVCIWEVSGGIFIVIIYLIYGMKEQKSQSKQVVWDIGLQTGSMLLFVLVINRLELVVILIILHIPVLPTQSPTKTQISAYLIIAFILIFLIYQNYINTIFILITLLLSFVQQVKKNIEIKVIENKIKIKRKLISILGAIPFLLILILIFNSRLQFQPIQSIICAGFSILSCLVPHLMREYLNKQVAQKYIKYVCFVDVLVGSVVNLNYFWIGIGGWTGLMVFIYGRRVRDIKFK